MQKRILIPLLAGLIYASTSLVMAQQTTLKIKPVPIQPTSPASATQMYATYCAVCHGAQGYGNGPAATAMKAHPTDLTLLTQSNAGVFPAAHVMTILKFGTANPAHGSADMPVWGDLMMSLRGTSPDNATVVHQRIANLTSYLKQMQR